jgi:N-methylhydantoinase B
MPDPVTLQIVSNGLQSIADEMATTIIRTAHSTVVRDGMDFSSALCDAHGVTVAQAVSVPFHLGSIPTAMDSLLARYGDRVRPGDVFIMNDPFDGGMHLQDIFVVKPVFMGASVLARAAAPPPGEERASHTALALAPRREETAGELIGWAVTTAHHGDVGGRLPGSSACDNTEIFQEGLRMPWLRFYAEGEPVEEVHRLIEANVRIPRMTSGDLGAQVAACSVAERALQALALRHGREQLEELMAALIDYTERLVRQEIASWPDGTATFTDYLGSDGVEAMDVPITATVTITGDEVTADLTESAPMVRGSLNSTRSFVMACVYQAVRCALTLEVPNTAGAFRPIHVLTKPGTVAEVVMPGASSMRGVTGFRVLDALNGALAQLIPHRVPAAGEGGNTLAIFGADRPGGGDRFVFYELVVGTWGGTPEADGNDGLTNPASLAANIPIEVAESEFPIVVERYGLLPDTGGAGEHRGGLAIERTWRCLTPDTSLIVRSDRADRPPYGLAGGGRGAPSHNLLLHPDGTEEVLPAMFSTTIAAGDVYAHRMAGGGGWGDPLARDPEAVARDVANEKVSVEAALELYGVVLGTDGEVNAAATAARRDERRGT